MTTNVATATIVAMKVSAAPAAPLLCDSCAGTGETLPPDLGTLAGATGAPVTCSDCLGRGHQLCDCCRAEPATSYDGVTLVGDRCAAELGVGDEATIEATADTEPCPAMAAEGA